MVAFSDLISLPSLRNVKETCLQLAREVGLPVDVWILGSPSERWIEIMARLIDSFLSTSSTQAVRGFFLDLATDPGDEGDLSADQTPRPGWLSALGFSWYGVERSGQTYATGEVTITNTGLTATLPFKPFDLTFQRSTLGADGGAPTYRNDADPSIYTGLGGTLTLAAGASITIPIVAEQIGSYATAAAGQISIVQTQTFGTLAGSNASAAIGTDREDAALYRARCRIAASKLSPGGPGAAYRYAANTARDGSPLQRFDGTGVVGITRTYVSTDSATGTVTVYFADPDGPATAVDVSSANANITGVPLGVITDPLGVLPDAITILPTVTDPNTGGPGGAPAEAVNITLDGTAKIKALPGGLAGQELIVAAQIAILSALAAAFSVFDIGGVDQVAGAGVIHTSDLACIVRDAYPGLYAVALTTPGTSTTAIAEGRVAVYVAPPAIIDATSFSGIILLEAIGHGLSTTDQVQVWDVVGTIEANGTWTVIVHDDDHFELNGSTFTNAYVSGGTFSRIVITVAP